METAQPNPAPAAAPKMEEIVLETPIIRGETTIDRLHIRKPAAGELRGLNLQTVMQGDFNALLALIPRISVPPIVPHEAEQLELADFAAIAGTVNGFFMSKTDQALMAKIMGAVEAETSPG